MSTWSLKNKNVLVIDDFAGMRSMLRSMLSAYGAENITEATNGVDAVEKMSDRLYDIVLCDYNLGEGKDGQQVLEEAKELGLIPYSTVYIMTTAENTSEMVMGAVEYQPDDYLSKPFTKEVLIARLKVLVNKKSELKPVASAIQLKDYDSAFQLCEKLLEKDSRNRTDILKVQSDIALKMEAYDKAEAIFNAVLVERDLPWARLGLGKVYYFNKKYEDAQAVLEKLTEEHPNFVFAHDCLAKVYLAQGEATKAQKILQDAIDKSPKAILRQKELASISYENGDLETSEFAYKRILRTGKHSCYRGPEDFMGLTKTYLKKGANLDASRALSNMRTEFRKSTPDKKIKALVTEALLYHEMEKFAEARKSIQEVLKSLKKNPAHLTSEDAIALAKICYKMDMNTEGDLLIQHVVRNNHDNNEMLEELANLLKEHGGEGKVAELIANTRDEVIAINNQGVELATQGKIEESIELFEKAAAAMSENSIVNLNAAQSLIMYMSKFSVEEEKLEQAMSYLSKIKYSGKPSEKHQKLMSICIKLQSTLPPK